METQAFISSPKVKVAVIKAAKEYRWTVEVTHEDPELALEWLKAAEADLRAQFSKPPPE